MMRAFFIGIVLALGACAPAPQSTDTAETAPAGVEIVDAWASPTPNGVTVSAGYMIIRNGGGEADRLVSAESARAGRVEVHEMVMDGDVMRMRPVEALTIAAGGEAVLAPGGQHLMFYEVATPFAEGEDVPVRLQFEHAGAVDVSLPVRRRGEATAHESGGH